MYEFKYECKFRCHNVISTRPVHLYLVGGGVAFTPNKDPYPHLLSGFVLVSPWHIKAIHN